MTMKVQKHAGNRNCDLVQFDSISEFYDFISTAPENYVFKNAWHLSSKSGSKYFTKTESFEEAVDLMFNGWDEGAQKLTQRLKAVEKGLAPVTKPRPKAGVVGYQAIVPAYLNGSPNSMMGTVRKPVKQPVINVTKMIAYSSGTSADTIIEESLKAMQIVKKLEAQGQRVNLFIIHSGSAHGKQIACRVKIKGANERLNVSKMAFPMCHPSMQRRLMFRFTETYEGVTKGFYDGYGRPSSKWDVEDILPKTEIVIPTFVYKDVSKLQTFEDLRKL